MSATVGRRRQRATPAFRGFHGPTDGIYDAALCAPEIERVMMTGVWISGTALDDQSICVAQVQVAV
jgi:hypothetical protein